MTERADRRSDARERALYALYEASVKGIEPAAVLAAHVVATRRADRRCSSRESPSTATGWTRRSTPRLKAGRLERMPVLDLNVLRLGAFELAERPDVPVAVVIDEAVVLAKRFSTDNSGRFVNGVLAALAPELRQESAGTADG